VESLTTIELPQTINRVSSLRAVLDPVPLRIDPARPIGGAATGACPQADALYTDPASFEGGSYLVQAGFAQMNVAAISVTLDPADFPLRIDMTEMIFATANATVTTTTEWSLLVWEGTPSNGQLIE